MKKIYVLFFAFSFLILSSACQKQNLTLNEVLDILYGVEVDYRKIAAYQTFEDFEGDDQEILSIKNQFEVYIHKSSNYQALDYMLYITAQHYYDTRSMRRSSHDLVILNFNDFKPILNNHLTVIDLDILNLTAILALLDSCEEPLTYSVYKQTYEIRGILNKDNHYKTITLTFNNEKLLNLSIQYELGFASTKQTSNYLYGKHYDFSGFIDIEFPLLDLFTT